MPTLLVVATAVGFVVASVVALRGARELPALLRGTRKQAQDGMVGEHDLPQQVRWRSHPEPQRPAARPRRPALCRSDLLASA